MLLKLELGIKIRCKSVTCSSLMTCAFIEKLSRLASSAAQCLPYSLASGLMYFIHARSHGSARRDQGNECRTSQITIPWLKVRFSNFETFVDETKASSGPLVLLRWASAWARISATEGGTLCPAFRALSLPAQPAADRPCWVELSWWAFRFPVGLV